ncbi:hypothetical protein BLSTO_01338 [Blastocystis sp. subtype 1]
MLSRVSLLSKSCKHLMPHRMASASANVLIDDVFGKYSFNDDMLQKSVPKFAYNKVVEARKNANIQLDKETADIVADAMMKWAESLGVTHFCHWFQPLSGVTAQKQDAFISRVNGKTVSNFTGKKLIKGEPDASSFPNGGLRETHMARGFTVWDPNSNPIIVKHDNGGTLYIPSVFLSWKGDVLDQKIPFLRSQEVLIQEANRLFKIIGHPQTDIDVNCGIEQEFFLIQREYYDKRPDLKLTGRTLFGCAPPKGQELHDQYFSEMTTKALNYIHDVEIEMWKLGIPTTTRHREVAPGQYELAPLYGESILATDQNLQSMELLRKQGRRHNLKALFHEKPFEGVNGSGKHNNWSLCSKETPTFLELGSHPEKNIPFIVSVAASIRAVDKYGDLLRACVTSASNDHRLGGNEAPPAIISMYLGEDVTNALELFMKKTTSRSSTGSADLNLGVCSIPNINREGTDRNRTSPFAFTVNKFEFRAVGSNQSAARSNMVINTIMADSFRFIADEIIRHKQSSFMTDEEAIQKTVTDIITKHNRIIFNGNGYSPEWKSRAQELGLPNNVASPEAIKAWTDAKNVELFTSLGVMKKSEIESRQSILWDQYNKDIMVEARTMCALCTERIIPTVFSAQAQFSASLSAVAALTSGGNSEQVGYVSFMAEELNATIKALNQLKKTIAAVKDLRGEEAISFFSRDDLIPAMNELRKHVDRLESTVDYRQWPLPNYASMFFNQS